MDKKPLHILLVEDDEVDAEYLVRSFRQQRGLLTWTVVGNGLEALALLRSPHSHTGLRYPYLIVTDINMPLMNGLEFLQALRQDPKLRKAVVYILSSSALETDKAAAYAHQVAGYLLKATLDQHLPQFLNLLTCYQALVEFPPHGE